MVKKLIVFIMTMMMIAVVSQAEEKTVPATEVAEQVAVDDQPAIEEINASTESNVTETVEEKAAQAEESAPKKDAP